jgi:integrase
MADLVRHERSDWTISTYHTHLTTFSEWLVSSGRLDHDPMADVRVPERPKSEPNPLSDADLNRVLAAATGITRDWILLALHAGLRAHEIAKLRGEHVQVEGIRVTGKGRKVVTLPCHPVIWDMAQRYPRSGYWFPAADGGHIPMPQVSGGVGTFFTGLGLEGGIHRVRHSYCTRLLRAGVHIRKVQKLMRHANLATTAGYAAVDEDELRDAILMLPPLPA